MDFKCLFSARPDLPCSRLFDDDGHFDRGGDGASRRSDDRKDFQLCAQVRRALELVFQSGDFALPDHVFIEDVVPDPDASRLRVTLSVGVRCSMSVPHLEAWLSSSRPRLRAAVAPSIHRKRVPQLVFECVPAKEELS